MVLGLFLLLGLGSLGVWGYVVLTGLGCSEAEKAVYKEFPQYGGRDIEPEANTGFGTCFASYQTRASKQKVQGYYESRLRENGWRIVRKPSPAGLAPPEKTVISEPVPGEPGKTREVPVGDGGELIVAERGNYFYQVSYESLRDYINPRPGLDVAVHVGEQ